jgi:hypothetical protein
MAVSGSARQRAPGLHFYFSTPIFYRSMWVGDSDSRGGVLGLGILLLRRYVPESPRWLVTHGYSRRAEETVAEIEERVRSDTGSELRKPEGQLKVHPRKNFGFALIFWSMLGKYRARSLLALTLMIAQSFLFNAAFFPTAWCSRSSREFQRTKRGSTCCRLPSAISWVLCCWGLCSTPSVAEP